MKKRLFAILGILIGVITFVLIIVTFPIWGVVWIITGKEPFTWISHKINKKYHNKLDELNKQTEEVKKELENLQKEVDLQDEIERLKRSN